MFGPVELLVFDVVFAESRENSPQYAFSHTLPCWPKNKVQTLASLQNSRKYGLLFFSIIYNLNKKKISKEKYSKLF